ELDLELDPPEVRRGRMEDEAVAARLERLGEAGDPPVVVGAALGDELGLSEELDPNAAGRGALAGVEDVRRERGGHARTLRLEAAAQPRQGLGALGALELTQRREPRRRRHCRAVDKVARERGEDGVDAVRIGFAPERMV